MSRSRLLGGIVLFAVLQTPMLAAPRLLSAQTAGPREISASVGSVDFIQYWAAHKLMLAGENPYDPLLMLAVQRPQGFADQEPKMCWNPPWLTTLLSPILGFSLRTSAQLWLGLNLVLTILVGLAIVVTYRGRLLMSPGLLAAFFLFQPIMSNLYLGQVGMLYALSTAGFLLAVSRQRDITAGFMLVLATIKPHLVYLVLPLLVYWMALRKRWRVLVGFVLGFVALVALTQTLYPGSIRHWVVTMSTRPPMHWVVGTLVGVTRLLFQPTGSPVPAWPISVIPGLMLVLFCGWLAWRRPEPDLRRLLPGVLALSLFTAPYGWSFDQCQLLLIQVGLVALAGRDDVPQSVRRSVWTALASVQVAWTVEQALGFNQLHHYFWSALALFVVWEYGMRKLRIIDWTTPLPSHLSRG
jgi:hypothetical protein